KRTNNDHLSVSRERNVANPAYQMFEGLQLQRSCMENPGDGLANWFVIKHTRDEALSSDLLSKYSFKAADATQARSLRLLTFTELYKEPPVIVLPSLRLNSMSKKKNIYKKTVAWSYSNRLKKIRRIILNISPFLLGALNICYVFSNTLEKTNIIFVKRAKEHFSFSTIQLDSSCNKMALRIFCELVFPINQTHTPVLSIIKFSLLNIGQRDLPEISEDSAKCDRCKRKMSAYFCAICEHFTDVDKNPYHFEKCAICGTNIDHLSQSRERNVANPAYQRYQGKQGVQRSGIENPGNGLADWFVIKHTKDQVLLRYLLSKYGFKAADATQKSNPQLTGSSSST
ncbi:unnamed protein product, partial [Porites lobata]